MTEGFENSRGTDMDKKLLDVFVSYMSKMHPKVWSLLIDNAADVESRLRERFWKVWHGPVSTVVGSMENTGSFTPQGSEKVQNLMVFLKSYITVGLLPGPDFYSNPSVAAVDIIVVYGSYKIRHSVPATVLADYDESVVRQIFLSLEQHLKLSIGA